MGQQQLLLLVLGIVIVGLAVVAGINAFSENQAKSEKDAIINEGMRVATDINAYALKPSELGGGGGTVASDTDLAAMFDGVDSGSDYETPFGTITYNHGSGSPYLQLKTNSNDGNAISEVVCVAGPTVETASGDCTAL